MANSKKPTSSSARRSPSNGIPAADATGPETEKERLDAATKAGSGTTDTDSAPTSSTGKASRAGDKTFGSDETSGEAKDDAATSANDKAGVDETAAAGSKGSDTVSGADAQKGEMPGLSAAPAPVSAKTTGTDDTAASSKPGSTSVSDAARGKDARMSKDTSSDNGSVLETASSSVPRSGAARSGTSGGTGTPGSTASASSASGVASGNSEAGSTAASPVRSGAARSAGTSTASGKADTAPRREGAASEPKIRSGPGFMTMLLGGVAAGAIGYLAAYYTEFRPFSEEPAQETAVDPLQGELEQQAATIASLQEQVAALSQTPETDPLAGVNDTVGTLQAEIEDLRAAIAGASDAEAGAATQEALEEIRRSAEESRTALAARLDEIASGGAGADAQGLAEFDSRLSAVTEQLGALAAQIEAQEFPSAEDMAALESRIAELNTQIDDRIAALDSEIETRIGELNGTIEAQAAQIAEAEAAAEAETRRVSSRAALSQIEAALENGTPYQDALGAFEASSDAEVPEPLGAPASEGVATLAELQAEYPDIARTGLDASLSETAGDGALNRFGAFLKAQTGARSLSEKDGADADAILSRAEARLREGDLAAALAELEALPEGGRAAMQEWIARAERRLEARTALSDLTAQLSSN